MTDPNLESCESGAHFPHPGEPCEEPEQTPAPPTGEPRDTIAEAARTVPLRLGPNAVGMAQRGEPIILNMGEADALADAVVPVVQAELARVSALHADTKRRLRADLADEVRKRAAAETEAKRLSLMVDEYGTGASALTDKIVAVRQLHRPYDDNREQIKRCVTCASREAYSNGVAIHEPWPCPTVRALDTPKENPHD